MSEYTCSWRPVERVRVPFCKVFQTTNENALAVAAALNALRDGDGGYALTKRVSVNETPVADAGAGYALILTLATAAGVGVKFRLDHFDPDTSIEDLVTLLLANVTTPTGTAVTHMTEALIKAVSYAPVSYAV